MSHFDCDQEAIIIGSYEDQYGHEYVTEPTYGVLRLKSGYYTAWYPEKVLHFIEHVGHEGIYEAIEKRQQREAEEKIKREKHNEFVKELTKEFDIEASIDALILEKMMEAVAKKNK